MTSFLAVFPLHRLDESFRAQFGDQGRVDIVVEIAARARRRHGDQDVFRAGTVYLGMDRSLCFEVGIALLDDLRIGELELLGQRVLGARRVEIAR